MAMIQRPSTLALMLCDHVVFEHETLKPSLIGVFTGVAVDGFPSTPRQMDAFVVLTDGLGTGTPELEVSELNTTNVVYAKQVQLICNDPLRVINTRLRIRQCSFPVPGEYVFTLRVDGEEIAHRRVRVY